MKKFNAVLLSLFFLLLFVKANAQNDIPTLLKNFSSSDWEKVKDAKEKLENMEGKAIPQIMPLLDENKVVKLQNTGSLIYPGAKKFYGYGQIVDYDIDNLSIRAGWLLEDITFNDFGFSGYHLPDKRLIPFIKVTFPRYYNNETNRKTIESSTSDQLRAIILKMSIQNAKKWWKEEGATWTRLKALGEALQSYDERRQDKALFYMRNGTTKCTGLTKDYYINNISKDIVRLSSSDTKRISENAKLILFDTKYTWLASKNK